MKKVTISIPAAMYERFRYERQGYGVKTVREVIEHKLKFWEGRWTDSHVQREEGRRDG